MKLSIGLPPSPDIVERARLAEALGYDTCWSFDSPAIVGDLWIALARVAEGTSRIKVGSAVAIPSLRHTLVTASALASIEHLAPGRLVYALGTGFTGRRMLGHRALSWKFMEDHIRALRALLRGETAVVEGHKVQMCHTRGMAPERPIEVPIVVAANGPKGLAVARALGDGVMCVGTPQPGFDWCALLMTGTVMQEGESFDSPRVFDAIGPGIAAAYHGAYDIGGPDAVDQLPGGKAWRESIEQTPEDERHFQIHLGHYTELTERDRAHIAPAMGAALTTSGTEEALRERFVALEAGGCTEIVYTPFGDVEREMRAMARAARLPGAA
jgi:5,10-methylenetetrahydromethanopterin reductase